LSLSTIEAIRDRLLTLIEAITPTTLSGNKFLRHRAERDGNLVDWAEKNPGACLRRVGAREVGPDEPPTVSNMTEERVIGVLEIRIAYPQTHRYGPDNARDRDDVIREDWKKIKYAISGDGGAARGNFTGTYDCTPLPATMEFDRGQGVDFMVIRWMCSFVRSTT
jgi:hypothetical protein